MSRYGGLGGKGNKMGGRQADDGKLGDRRFVWEMFLSFFFFFSFIIYGISALDNR